MKSFQSTIFTKSLMNLLYNFPSARKIATANKKQLIDTMKIDNQLYFDENKLDQIIILSKNSIASDNDAHELALQKRIELLFKLESDHKLFAATLAIQNNEYFKNYYLKLRTRGKSHIVAVSAVVGKLLRIIYSLVKNKEKYDPNYHYKLQNQEMRVHSNYTAKKLKRKRKIVT